MAKKTINAAPVACQGTCGCGKGGKFGRFVKKLIIFLIIFAIGFAVGKFCGKAHRHGAMGFGHPEFVNGCLAVSEIKSPKFAEKVALMDADGNGCITKEEFLAGRKSLIKERRAGGCSHCDSCEG